MTDFFVPSYSFFSLFFFFLSRFIGFLDYFEVRTYEQMYSIFNHHPTGKTKLSFQLSWDITLKPLCASLHLLSSHSFLQVSNLWGFRKSCGDFGHAFLYILNPEKRQNKASVNIFWTKIKKSRGPAHWCCLQPSWDCVAAGCCKQ